MIEFLKLRACLVRIKGCHALKWGTQLYQHRTTVARQRTSVHFKLAVRGDTGAGGSTFTAYFGKLAILLGCSLSQQA